MKFEELSLIELVKLLQEQKVSSVEVTKYFIEPLNDNLYVYYITSNYGISGVI